MDLARAPRRAPLTARKKGSGYENEYKQYSRMSSTVVIFLVLFRIQEIQVSMFLALIICRMKVNH